MSTIPPQAEIIYKIYKISLAQQAGEHIKLSYMSSAKMCNHRRRRNNLQDLQDLARRCAEQENK